MSEINPPALPPLPTREVKVKPADQVEQAAKEFEGVFLGEMMKIMLETVPENERFGGGNAERIYKGMLGAQLGEAIAEKGGIGLAPHVMQAIIERQGGQ